MSDGVGDADVAEALAPEQAMMFAACVGPTIAEAATRALVWWRLLERAGLAVPMFVAHDVGRLVTARGEQLTFGTPAQLPSAVQRDAEAYAELMSQLAQTAVVQRLATLRLRDVVVAGLLSRLLAPLSAYLPRRFGARFPGGADSSQRDLGAQARDVDGARVRWNAVVAAGEAVRLTCELLDLDGVRALSQLGTDGEPLEDWVDIAAVLGSPEAQDAAAFSLDLLPSLLPAQRVNAASPVTEGGYASVERRGSLESLLPTELMLDDALFELRWRDDELLYWGRERETKEMEREHWLLVDASASMRGIRSVFARGLALALGVACARRDEPVLLRFFDARLHEPVTGHAAGLPAAAVLGFRGQEPRYLDRVFGQLRHALSRYVGQRQVVVHVITHGHAHVDPDIMRAVAGLCELRAVFVEADKKPRWAEFATQVDVVAASALADQRERRRRAVEIVDATRGAA